MKTHVRSKCSTFDFDKQLNQLTGADVSDEEWRRSFLEPISIERHAAAASLFKELSSLDNFPDAGLRCACCVRPLAKNKMSTMALSKLRNLSVLSATGRQTLQEPRHALTFLDTAAGRFCLSVQGIASYRCPKHGQVDSPLSLFHMLEGEGAPSHHHLIPR